MGNSPNHPSPAVLSAIAQAIRSIRFGTVRIMIHDARVVQIEKAEKFRMDAAADLTPGGASENPSLADQTAGVARSAGGGSS